MAVAITEVKTMNAMPETIEIEQISIPDASEVKVELTLTSKVNFTALASQRRVSKLMLEQVGLFYGEQPNLVISNRLLWRVPVWLSMPTTGPLGQVGSIDVDAQTGEILYTPEMLADIKERGRYLAQAVNTPSTLS